MRRDFVRTMTGCLGVLLAVVLFLGVSSIQAQDFPSKPIDLVIPFGSGGSSDIISRGITGKATELLGQPIVIHTKPGGGGRHW